MGRHKTVSEEEKKQIRAMLRAHTPKAEIARKMKRSLPTISKIAESVPDSLEEWSIQTDNWKRKWLEKNWRWEIPERKPEKPGKPQERAFIVAKKKRSNFITPYNYPRMWDYRNEED